MEKFTIVIAEEKETIQRLLNKAVNSKPLGREKINQVISVLNEAELKSQLTTEPTILLLSTTFSTRSHKELVQELLEHHQNIHVLTLSHRYGDRSSIEYGAIESVDKPIRNPVLWEKLDRVMAILSEKASVKPPTSQVISDEQTSPEKPVVVQKAIPAKQVVIEEDEDIVVIEKRVQTPSNRNNIVVIDDDDDDYDDDMFESSKAVSKKRTVVEVPKDSIQVPIQEVIEQAPTTIEPETGMNETDEVIPFNNPMNEERAHESEPVTQTVGSESSVEAEVESSNEEISLPTIDFEDEEKDLSESKNDSSDGLPEIELNEEVESDNTVDSSTLLEEKQEQQDEEPVFFETTLEEPPPNKLEQPKTNLEPISDIKAETSIYNEKSEWTLAKEGFTTRKGNFVPIQPPRELMNRHLSSNRRVVRQTSPVESTNESVGLFGSVRKLFTRK